MYYYGYDAAQIEEDMLTFFLSGEIFKHSQIHFTIGKCKLFRTLRGMNVNTDTEEV